MSCPSPFPEELSSAQINDACLSYRHDFGLLDPKTQDTVRFQAREWCRALARAANTTFPASAPTPLSTTTLKPCPFCAGAAVVFLKDHACCGNEKCIGWHIKATIPEWNTRTS